MVHFHVLSPSTFFRLYTGFLGPVLHRNSNSGRIALAKCLLTPAITAQFAHVGANTLQSHIYAST